MGKSYRKNPIFKNTTADSEKRDKQICNRKVRGATRAALKNYNPETDEDLVLPEPNEVHNVHLFDGDGKHYAYEGRWNWDRGPDKRDLSK